MTVRVPRVVGISLLAFFAACSQEGSVASGADAEDALAYFHLLESGSGRVSFADVSRRGDARIFSDVTIETPDDGMLHADTLRLTDPRSADDGATFRALELDNLTASEDGAEFALDRLVIEEPNARLAALIAAALAWEEIDEDGDWGEPSEYAFGSLALEGLNAHGEDGGAVSFDTLRLDDWTGDRLGEFRFENLAVTGEGEESGDVAFSLGSWTASGLNLDGIDAFANINEDSEDEIMRALAESGFMSTFARKYDDYAIRDARLDADGVLVGLDSLEGRAQQTRVGVETTERLVGLTVDFDESKAAGAKALAGLQMLGYDRLEFNGEFGFLADEVHDRIITRDYFLDARDAFRLEIDADIGGVDAYVKNAVKESLRAGAEMDPDELMRVAAPLKLHGFELRLIDDSFVARAIEAAATSQKVTPEQAREQAIALLTVGAAFAPPGPTQTLIADAVDAITTFLQDPGTLTVSVTPAHDGEPVSLADLSAALEDEDPERAFDLVNIRIDAE